LMDDLIGFGVVVLPWFFFGNILNTSQTLFLLTGPW
jgi:hypothetical protein